MLKNIWKGFKERYLNSFTFKVSNWQKSTCLSVLCKLAPQIGFQNLFLHSFYTSLIQWTPSSGSAGGKVQAHSLRSIIFFFFFLSTLHKITFLEWMFNFRWNLCFMFITFMPHICSWRKPLALDYYSVFEKFPDDTIFAQK